MAKARLRFAIDRRRKALALEEGVDAFPLASLKSAGVSVNKVGSPRRGKQVVDEVLFGHDGRRVLVLAGEAAAKGGDNFGKGGFSVFHGLLVSHRDGIGALVDQIPSKLG